MYTHRIDVRKNTRLMSEASKMTGSSAIDHKCSYLSSATLQSKYGVMNSAIIHAMFFVPDRLICGSVHLSRIFVQASLVVEIYYIKAHSRMLASTFRDDHVSLSK
ncbi:hypothetical protein BDEG_28005 [Batrachochytrium dendrobatidis JEL423]|uniref:Uncharacterized protein n=1 Tax=Batrachochytrium dendrobatidis (strain JEL423) TaxID=403673 RepID=A0A177WXI9_BATDL|nr:hypothetical protein BDEG_28005 [Batrachochytrium dendrobatidis JEL423]